MKNQTTLTRSILVLSLAIIFILPMWFAATLEAQSDKRLLERVQVNKLPEKGKRFALVIGVDEYQDQQALKGAAKDARELAKALIENAGFEPENVTLIATGEPPSRQPNRAIILDWLSRLRKDMPKDGLFLFSFAGHGMERDGQAYLLPTDAVTKGDLDLVEETSINVQRVSESIRRSGIKQVMMILDACRNNPEGRDIGVTDKTANKLTESYTRGFNFEARNQEIEAFVKLYSTSVGQLAYEDKDKNQGYFTYALVEGLKGAAANANGEVTLAGLVKYVEEQVPKRITSNYGREKHQKPWVEMQGYKANELVISITVNVIVNNLALTVDPVAVEIKLWDSVKESKDPADYRAYLEKYPNGTFSGVARNRIRQYEAFAKTDTSSTNPIASQPKSLSKEMPASTFIAFTNQKYRIQYPSNWQVFDGQDGNVTFAPDWAIVGNDITRGVIVGSYSPKRNNGTVTPTKALNTLINDLRQSNSFLEENERDRYTESLAGKDALATFMFGRNPIGFDERVWIVARPNSNDVVYMVFLVSENEFSQYKPTFDSMRKSFELIQR